MNIGFVIGINGSVIHAKFPVAPKLYNKLIANGVVIEVAEVMENNIVKGIALTAINGLSLNDKIVDTGESIEIPVCDQLLGRVLNVFGEPVDDKGKIESDNFAPIHATPAKFYEKSGEKKNI